MAKTVLIFGGAGFVGRYLFWELKRKGYDVLVVDDYTVEPFERPPSGSVIEADVRSPNAVREALKDYTPEIVYWFPARQGYRKDYSNFARTQVAASYGFFEALGKLPSYKPERIVLASSQAIYGPGKNVPESWDHHPQSTYGLSKLQQEEAFIHFCRELSVDGHDVTLVCMRYSIILGAGQSLDANESGLIRNWYHAWKKNRHPEIYGDGTQMRDFVHISDVTRANVLAGETPLPENPVAQFNIAGKAAKILQVFDVFQALTGCKDARVLHAPVRPGGEYTLWSGGRRASQLLEYEPTVGIEEQIRDFLDAVTKK